MLACPHCSTSIDLRQVRHEGWFTTRRMCPSCKLAFDLDASTKVRQGLFLASAILALTFTVLAWLYGSAWGGWAAASYVLAGALLYYGNRKIYLIKASDSDKGDGADASR